MLQEITTDALFHYAVIFCRLGSIFLFIPGFGESYVATRARLSLAMISSLVFYPLLSENFPAMPEEILHIFLILLGEITIGLFIGLMMRLIQSVLHITGMKIAFMSGLSTATLFDANQSTQGSVIGGFLSVIGITLFFTTGLHHIVFSSFYESYEVFRPNQTLPFNGLAETSYRLLSEVFLIAFKISTPIIITGLMLYLAAGLMGRLMPSMQVFFVLLPIQILTGFLFLGLSISTMMLVYINFFEEQLIRLF